MVAVLAIVLLMFASFTALAQNDQPVKSILDQNISIVADEEPLSDVIKRICDRITSYNVCYTKLLRWEQSSRA